MGFSLGSRRGPEVSQPSARSTPYRREYFVARTTFRDSLPRFLTKTDTRATVRGSGERMAVESFAAGLFRVATANLSL